MKNPDAPHVAEARQILKKVGRECMIFTEISRLDI